MLKPEGIIWPKQGMLVKPVLLVLDAEAKGVAT
jgi:hypothetical protein